MHPAGLEMVTIAQQTSTLNVVDDLENLILPEDLTALFLKNPITFEHWEGFPPFSNRGILEWILNAKKPETRQKELMKRLHWQRKTLKQIFKSMVNALEVDRISSDRIPKKFILCFSLAYLLDGTGFFPINSGIRFGLGG
jgi:hypothetical protein